MQWAQKSSMKQNNCLLHYISFQITGIALQTILGRGHYKSFEVNVRGNEFNVKFSQRIEYQTLKQNILSLLLRLQMLWLVAFDPILNRIFTLLLLQLLWLIHTKT